MCLTFCFLQFLKFVNFREYYSLEFAMWFLFAFGPYFLAEGLHLSGIMAVLFCGIVMSHYTHYNLTPVTQVTVQQTMRTVSFLAGTWIFVKFLKGLSPIYPSACSGTCMWTMQRQSHLSAHSSSELVPFSMTSLLLTFVHDDPLPF